MITTNKYFITFFISIVLLLFIEISYLNYKYTITDTQSSNKNSFIKLTTMPDLAIYSSNPYIRNRSLSSIGDIYKDDGVLREYTKGSYIYSTYNLTNKSENL